MIIIENSWANIKSYLVGHFNFSHCAFDLDGCKEKKIDVENDSDTDIKIFENDKEKCVVICVGKIGYGYDNDFIDFICLGDPRQSDIDIRQIIGRGLRWKKEVYPNKLLHLLVPLYRDEFGNCVKNEHLKKYLDYIIFR